MLWLLKYTGTGRTLQRLIIAILKQWLTTEIDRVNYAKNYTLVEGKVSRTEQKIVLFTTTEEKKAKLEAFLEKQGAGSVSWIG